MDILINRTHIICLVRPEPGFESRTVRSLVERSPHCANVVDKSSAIPIELTKSRQTTCTLYEQSGPKINNNALPMATHPKVLSLTLDQNFTCSTHIHSISVHVHKPLDIIKALTATGWGKQKETLMATYKAVMRPALEYRSSICSPLASSTSINKLQVMQNAALRTAT